MTLVLLIDGENISCQHASQVYEMAKAIGCWSKGSIYGNSTCLKSWRPSVQDWKLTERQTGKEKQAADRLLSQEAKDELLQGVRDFILVANDGHYALPVKQLCQKSALVFGIGNGSQYSQKLRHACTDVFVIGKDSVKEIAGRVQKHQKQRSPLPFQPEIRIEETKVVAAPETQTASGMVNHSHLLAIFLEAVYLKLCSSPEGGYLPVGWTPEYYSRLLKELALDVLYSPLLVGERKQQWLWVQAFAENCYQAYLRGYQVATHPHPSLPDERDQVWDQKTIGLTSPVSFQHLQFDEKKILQQWFSSGYHMGKKVIQEQQQRAWSCWYEQREKQS